MFCSRIVKDYVYAGLLFLMWYVILPKYEAEDSTYLWVKTLYERLFRSFGRHLFISIVLGHQLAFVLHTSIRISHYIYEFWSVNSGPLFNIIVIYYLKRSTVDQVVRFFISWIWKLPANFFHMVVLASLRSITRDGTNFWDICHLFCVESNRPLYLL